MIEMIGGIQNFYFLAFDARQDKPEEVWAEMFKALDEDHDGFVNIDELRDDMATVLKGETRETISTIFIPTNALSSFEIQYVKLVL
jgi:Ca2+-binding EF-hand superfamily protein